MTYDTIVKKIARAIALVAPGYAAGYMKSHALVRAYAAAKTTGVDRNFKPPQSSGAQEIVQSWQTVTNKTRALQRDNAHVAGMGRRFVASLVGEGSWPRPKILKAGAADKYDFDSALNADILARWERWAPEACANGDSIYQLQRIAAHHFFFDGGLLIRRVVINTARGKQLALEPIELDQLDTLRDTDPGTGSGVRIVGGKELNEYNRVAAYWIKSRHPAEVSTDSKRIPADEIIDLFDRNRASDVGGISRLAPCVLNFHNIGMYRSDTMKLARTALGYGVFVSTEYPDDFFRGDGDDDEKGNEYDYITPGGVHYLRPGESINTVKPENPGAQYEPFLRSELRGASLGAGMSYESASNDGSQTNFSGTRQMLLFDRAMTRYTFAIFEEKFYSRLYRWFVEFEMDFGKPALRLAGYDMTPEKYLRCSWSRPKTEWVDPLKDAKAGKEEVDMGVNTLTELCEVAGRDIEEVVATRKYEQALFKAAGIASELAPAPVAQPAPIIEGAEENAE